MHYDGSTGLLASPARLIIQQAGGEQTVLPLGTAPVTVGRGGDNTIVLHDDQVSRRHLEIVPGADGRYYLRDLGSANGVVVNGQPTRSAPLQPGDRIQVGETFLTFVFDTSVPTAPPTATVGTGYAPQLPYAPPPPVYTPPYTPQQPLTIPPFVRGMEGMTANQLQAELSRGGRFVIFQYCISALVITFKRNSGIYFIRAGGGAAGKSIKFTLLSLFLGWWGIPWGPIYTVQSLVTNFGGGKDVTPQVMAALNTNGSR